MNRDNLATIAVLLIAAPILQGCVAAAGGAAATGAVIATDRRTTGTFIDDELIELKVLDALRRDKQLWDQTHVNATSFNNVVLLTGEAPGESLRDRVVEIARGIPKVRRVHNEIKIAAPSSMVTRSGDSLTTGKVKTALLQAEGVQFNRVKVVTENGVVYLMGLVTRGEAEVATDVARRVGGVQRVVKVMEYID